MLSVPYIVKNADSIWYQIRWSATGGTPTCVCGCNSLYKLGDGRYKCKHCGKVFSDRTGTLLHHSKLSLDKWLVAIFKFAVNQECSAIDLQKEIGVNYNTAYMLLQKLRYLVGKQELSLEGIIRIDEAYIGAEWKNVHFNKKMDYMRSEGFISPDSKRYTKSQLLAAVSAKKSHILSITDEHNTTRLIHTPNPITKETIECIIKKHSITGIVSDESSLYTGLGLPVYQSNHSKHIFITENGMSSNVCENRFSWVKRKLEGVFSHCSDKYLQLYLNQRQFHYNSLCKSVDERFYTIVGMSTSVIITYKHIKGFDYKADFPVSRRHKVDEQVEESVEALESLGLVESIESKYKSLQL